MSPQMKEGIEASLRIFDNDDGDASSPPPRGVLKKTISNEPSESVTEETSAMTSAANTSATDFTFEIDLPPPDDVSPLSCQESVVTAMLNRTLDRTLEQVLPLVPSLTEEEEDDDDDCNPRQQTISPPKRYERSSYNHHHHRRNHHHRHHDNRHSDHRHDAHRRTSDHQTDYAPKDDRRRRSRSTTGLRHSNHSLSEDGSDQKRRSSRHRSTSERPTSRRSKSRDYGDSIGSSSHRTGSRSRDALSSSDEKKRRHRSRSRAAIEREGEKPRGLTISSIREEVEEDMAAESQKPSDKQTKIKPLTKALSPIPPSSHRSPTKRSSISAPRSPSRRSERSHSKTGETTSAPRSPSSPKNERSHSRTGETRSHSRSRRSSPSKFSGSRRSESKSRRSSSYIPADRERSMSKSRARSNSHRKPSSSTGEVSSLLFNPAVAGESLVGTLRPSFLSRLAEVNEKAEEEQDIDEVDQIDKEEIPKSIRRGESEETENPIKSKNKTGTSIEIVADGSGETSQRKLNAGLRQKGKKRRARSLSRAGRSHSKSRSRGESKAGDNPEQKDRKPGWNELLNLSMQLSTDSFKFDPADVENVAQAGPTKEHRTAVGGESETIPVTNGAMERLRKANALILEKKKRREESKARQKQLDIMKSPSPVDEAGTTGLENLEALSGEKEEMKTPVSPLQVESVHDDVKMQKHPEFSASANMESFDMLNLDIPDSPKVVEAGAQFLPALRESNEAIFDNATTGSPLKGIQTKLESETKVTEESSKNTRNRRRENRMRDGRKGNRTKTSNKWRELQTRVDALTKSDSKPQEPTIVSSSTQDILEMESPKGDSLQTGSDEKTKSQKEPLEPVLEVTKPKSSKIFDSLRQSLHGQSMHGKSDSKIWGMKKEKKSDETDQNEEAQAGKSRSMKWGSSSKKPEGANLEEDSTQEVQSNSSVGRSKWAGVKGSLLFISLMKSKAADSEP